MNHSGILRKIVANKNDGCCDEWYVFITDSEVSLEQLTNNSDAPTNIRISVEIIDDVIVSWDYLNDIRQYKDNRVKDIALVRIVSSDRNSEEEIQKVNKEARDLEDFFKHVNEGYWEHVSVTPYFIVNTKQLGVGVHSFNFSHYEDELRAQYPDQPDLYDKHNYWHGWGGYHPDYLGLAFLDGPKAWTYASGQRTMRHEQGHNFGCPHSSTDGDEYGDPTCVMARAHTGFNAWQMLRMYQMDTKHFKEVSPQDSGTHYLCPTEISTTDVRQGEYKTLLLRTDTFRSLGLSTRKSSNQSFLGTRREEGQLFIHGVTVSPDVIVKGGNTMYVKSLDTGDVFEKDGVVIKNAGSQDGIVKVEINNPASEESYPQPLPVIDGESFTKDHSVVWHNPIYKHQGIDMFVIPERKKVIGYWFTHSPRGETSYGLSRISSRCWYVIDGDIDEETNIVNCTIYSTYGKETQVDGHGSLRLDDNTLTFRYYTNSYGRDRMRLQPLTPPKNSDISGIYETGEHEGFSVGKYDNFYVAYNFTYGRVSTHDLEWEIYQGNDPASLFGYKVDGRYKITYEKPVTEIQKLNLNNLMETSTKIL